MASSSRPSSSAHDNGTIGRDEYITSDSFSPWRASSAAAFLSLQISVSRYQVTLSTSLIRCVLSSSSGPPPSWRLTLLPRPSTLPRRMPFQSPSLRVPQLVLDLRLHQVTTMPPPPLLPPKLLLRLRPRPPPLRSAASRSAHGIGGTGASLLAAATTLPATRPRLHRLPLARPPLLRP